uniref:Putative histone-lysine n-methyltransferase mll5 n=1 Tax=Lutzomyia longipalpis TaxID=7200 RepID=A0A1B0CRL4_LUTLO
MICCDKCSAWQHVDCMGIDRQNIPDEYNCEMCQPRPVDKARARNLQLIKRKEQQALMMLNTLPQQTIPLDGGVHLISSPVMEAQRGVGGVPLNSLSPGSTKKQRSVRKKGESFVAAKRQKRESSGGGRANGKRKETKKVTKRKGKQQQMQNVENGGGGGLGEKTVMNLRAWIENYEQAVTNHYSPELRARLQALGKQQSHQQLNSQQYNLRNVGNLDGKCGTVPHAGGKILISSHEVTPNTPIVEIRGKYMLSGQYKQQLITSSNSTRNYGLNRNPGPFIFFYRLPNDGPEICVDTRTYGNEARFVRRSCRPNAEVVHFIEKGTIHLYIVSMLNIKESTEITIRHEPHDLIGVTQGSVLAPTSTVCACGLTKDCLFPNSGAPPLPQPAGGGSGGSTKPSGKRVNGTYHGKNSKEGGYKRSKALSRNRSTSSSGESNVGGLLSPNGQVFVPNQLSTTALAPPSIQPQLLEAAAAALSSPQASLPPTVTQMLNQYPPSPTRNHLNISAASSATTMSIPETPTLLSPNLEQVVSPKEPINVAMLSPILPPQVTPESPVKIPKPPELQQPENSQQTNAQQPPSQQPANPPPTTPTNPPKVPTKRVQKQKSAPTTPLIQEECEKKSPIKVAEQEKQLEQGAKEAPEQRKLTREERKMEAILKAFEKMEKTSQRKQELKQQKTSDRASTSGASSSVSRRRNSFSPFGGGVAQKMGKDEDDRKVLNNHQGKKKKRKGSKSYQQTNTQRKRRRSRVNSNDSDNATSEESGAMLSPPLPGHSLYRHSEPVKVQPGEDNVAGMLLALAKPPGESKMEPLHIAADATDVSATGPFHGSPLSSVCMLVEAAVAPLENQCAENDFKLPPKTKTKKTIMNEWLNQADAGIYPGSEAFGAPASKNLETLVQAAVSIHAPQHYRGVAMQEEPQNLSMMAKKVEEFITLNDTKAPQEQSFGTSEDEEVLQQQRTQQQTEGTAVLQIPPPLPTPPMAGGSESAVKKRWLRQAISEECLDEMVPSPPNGFMTPLKKRRFTRQYSDHPEDLSPTQTGFFAMTPQSEDSTKIEFPETPETTETTETPEIVGTTETVEIKTEEEVKTEENPEEASVEIKTEAQEVPKNEIEVKENVEEAIKTEEEEKKPIEEGIKEEIIDKAPHSSGEIESEVFDIEPLNASKDMKEDDGNLADIEDVNNDEIADLQKKIHSFHAENIQILKSRNRKAKQRAASEEKCERKLLKVRKKRLSSDTDEHAMKTKVKKIKSRSASRSPKYEQKDDAKEAEAVAQPSVPSIELPPSFNSSIPPPTTVPTYSSYLLNNATNLMTNVPPPNTFTMPSMFNANYPPPQVDDFHRGPGMEMRLAATNVPPPPPPQLSDYLDKSTTFRDIFATATNLPQGGAPPVATRSPYFATLNTVPPQPVPPPAVPPVAPTGFLPKATFTTLDPIPAGPTPVAAVPTPRIYQRTASADPRLNPNISVPEPPPAPKRKLSITEYRKRKQQSTDSSTANDSKSPPDTADQKDLDGDFGITKNPDGLSDCKDDSSSSASATKTPSTPEENVPFSPTPTLLELQQESLSERLKNYKSLQELSGGPSARESFSNQDGLEENPSVSSTTCDAVISSTVVATTATTDPGEEKVCEDSQEEITTTSEIGVSDVKVPEENP